MFNKNENIKNYFVYQYHHMDDLSAVLKPNEVYSYFGDYQKENEKIIAATVEEVVKLFKNNGWEGDGDIGVIWVPPFIDIGLEEDTWGGYLWHVKQSNNGTSFIASPIPLNLRRLNEQNDEVSKNDYRNMEPINIIQHNAEGFLKRLTKEKEYFEQEYKKLTREEDEVSKSILEKLLGYTQCDLIAQLNDFFNDCYLELLIEVLNNGNRGKIKLKRSSVNIDLSKHNHFEEGFEDDGATWMSINMFISDIWRSYKLEPFKEKYERLTKSLDFTVDNNLRDFIFKHIVIRNCIQHHDWQLEAPALNSLGRTSIQILTDKKPIDIKEWKIIVLTKQELDRLFELLVTFVTEINKHVDVRVMTRHYRPKNGGDYIVKK